MVRRIVLAARASSCPECAPFRTGVAVIIAATEKKGISLGKTTFSV
jgi:hypothetical protein